MSYWVDVCRGELAPDGSGIRDCWDRIAFDHYEKLSFAGAMDSADRAMDEYADDPDAVLVAIYGGYGDEQVAWLRDGKDWRRA